MTVAACGSASAQLLTAQGVQREIPQNPPVEETVRGITAFGHALLTATVTPDKNAVLSPLSIAYAYGMARAGAVGTTGEELDRVFGFPAQGPHTAFNALTRQIVTDQVAIANGMFAQLDTTVGQDFLHTLAAQYGVGVHTVDFRGDAADVINGWADKNTAGRIKKVFDHLDEDTKLVLANAIYLKADWKHPFKDGKEEGAAFTRADGSTVKTDLMRLQAHLGYASGPGWQAVELPYAKSDLAMWVLVPQKGSAPDRLLSPDTLQDVAKGLKPTGVDLLMPKWDFGTTLDLMPPVAKLGLRGNDFSGIAPDVFLDQAVHRANITVDEWGTEAAAVTGLAFPSSGMAPEVEVRADHPFAFAIVHKPTSTPLFVGQVADPTAKGL